MGEKDKKGKGKVDCKTVCRKDGAKVDLCADPNHPGKLEEKVIGKCSP